MLMRGDIQRIVDQINPILEGYGKRLEALEKAMEEVTKEKPKSTPKAKGVNKDD